MTSIVSLNGWIFLNGTSMELIAIGIFLDLWLIKWWTIYVLFHALIVLSESMVIKLQNCWNVRFGLLYYIMLWLANSHSGSLKGSVHAALHIGPPPLPESLSSATPYWALPQPLTSSSKIEIFDIFCIPCSFQQCNNSPVDSHTSTVGKKTFCRRAAKTCFWICSPRRGKKRKHELKRLPHVNKTLLMNF